MIALSDSKKPCSSCLEGGQSNGHKLSGEAGMADVVLTTNTTKEDQQKHTQFLKSSQTFCLWVTEKGGRCAEREARFLAVKEQTNPQHCPRLSISSYVH